jgi:2-keto-4-pentenoate hydratase
MTMVASRLAGPAAERILSAWRGADRPPAALPDVLRPRNLAEAYAIQEAVSLELGAIGGWRICVATPAAPLACAPLPLARVHPGTIRLLSAAHALVRAQPVLCLRVGQALPDYDAPFTGRQVLAAIETASVGAEILAPRVARDGAADGLTAVADSCGHAGLVHGRSVSAWRNGAAIELVITRVAGRRRSIVRHDLRIADVTGPLGWLASDGSRWGGGLQVGQLVVISLPLDELRIAPGSAVRLAADGLGTAEVRVGEAVRRAGVPA